MNITWNWIWISLGSLAGLLLLLFIWLYITDSLWLQALLKGAPVNPFRLVLMHIQKIDAKLILDLKIRAAIAHIYIPTYQLENYVMETDEPSLRKMIDASIKAQGAGIPIDLKVLRDFQISGGDVVLLVDAMIPAHKAGIIVDIDKLASHHLAKGDIVRVCTAMVSAKDAGIPLSFEQAGAIDLAGRDILEAVQSTVQPKVITTPKIKQKAKDGIELIVTARITVKTNLEKLVGGAGEETILARVGEGIITAIGMADHHGDILGMPDKITNQILRDELDRGTAFSIISVDIADIDVGENIGARIEIENAEKETRIAQARAEKEEQEKRVEILANRAKLLAKEADVLNAMAEAFKEGKMHVMDYYRWRNLRADTDMRRGFAGSGRNGEDDSKE